MKKHVLFIATTAVLLAGCAKEVEKPVEEQTGKLYTITALVDNPETRTLAEYNSGTNKYKFSWDTGESISVVSVNPSSKLLFQVSDTENGIFTYQAGADETYEGFGMAVTPGYVLGENPTVNNYSIELSGDYVYGQSNAIMIAGAPRIDGQNYKFQFKHAAALVQVTYNNVPAGTKAMVLTSANNITGTATKTSATEVSIAIGDLSGTTGKEARVNFADALDEAMSTAVFYVPIPIGSYQSFDIKLVNNSDVEIPGSAFTISAGSAVDVVVGNVLMFPAKTVETPIVKGAHNTLALNSNTKFSTGNSLTVSGISWGYQITAGAGNPAPGNFDSDRGQQFGTAKDNTTKSIVFTGTGYSSWSSTQLNNEYAVGIKTINVSVGAKNDNIVTVTVNVGGTEMTPVGSNEYTAADNRYGTLCFESDGLLEGTIVVSATLSTAGAFYLYSVDINPTPSLSSPIIESSSEGSTVTVSWETVTNAEKYDVVIVDRNNSENTFSKTDLTTTSTSFENVPDGTYTITVTAKAEGYNDGIGTQSVVVKASGPDKYTRVEDGAAFEDGGKYVFVIRDGISSSTYYALHTDRSLSSELTISNGKIIEPDEEFIFVAEAGSGNNAGKFALKNLSTGKYIPNAGAPTQIPSNDPDYITLSYLSASNCYKIDLGSRFVAFFNSSEVRYYQSGFEDQIAGNKALTSQKSGAFEVYMLGYQVKEMLPTPTGLEVNGKTLSWNSVSGAASYTVAIGSTTVSNITETSYVFDGEDEYYDVSVVAVPSSSDYTNSLAATLSNAKFGNPTLTQPVLEAGEIGESSISVSWTADPRATNGYYASIENNSIEVSHQDVAASTTTVVFTELENNTEYTVKVYAKAVTGTKAYAQSPVGSGVFSTHTISETEQDIYSTGFEDYPTGTNYQGTVNHEDWTVYYGNFSTTSPITGSTSLQMRLYSNGIVGYAITPSFNKATSISFKYSVSQTAVTFDVQYSNDGGSTWTTVQSVTSSSTTAAQLTVNAPSVDSQSKFRFLVTGGFPSQKSNNIIIDDVVVKGMVAQ